MRMCFWHGNADCDRKGKEDGNLNGSSTNLGQKNKCYFSKISCIFQKKCFPKIDSVFEKKNKYGGFQGIATLIVKVLSMLSQELTLHVLFRESRLSSRPFVKSRWSWESKIGIGKRYFFLVHMTWCVSFSIFFDVWKRKCGDKIWVMVKFDFDVCFFHIGIPASNQRMQWCLTLVINPQMTQFNLQENIGAGAMRFFLFLIVMTKKNTVWKHGNAQLRFQWDFGNA